MKYKYSYGATPILLSHQFSCEEVPMPFGSLDVICESLQRIFKVALVRAEYCRVLEVVFPLVSWQ